MTLREIRLFEGLNDAALAALEPAVTLRTLPKGQVLFLENDPCHAFYAVRTGAAKVYKLAPDGREYVVMIARAGETFAEVPAFDGGAYPANAETLEESELYEIEATRFREILRKDPGVALALLADMSTRLRAYTRQIEDLTFRNVSNRLADYLLRAARAGGEEREDGIHVQLTMSQQELAANIGTVREIVSRSLRKLEQAGLISHKGKHIVIHDVDGLAAHQ